MGEQDLERLYPIYRACTDFCTIAELPFSFKEDLGDYETIIAINGNDWYRPDPKQDWNSICGEIFVPDIIDYSNHIIIEFEEETGPRKSGSRLARKGHGHEGDLDTKRDTKRNEYYKQAGFSVFRLWELTYKNENWKAKLFMFLLECWEKSLEAKQ